jgi:hypothetical protein
MRNTKHLSFCDYIAQTIKKAVDHDSVCADGLLAGCGSIKADLHPTDGYLMTTTKTMSVADRNGRLYEITVKDVTK